MRSVRCYAVKRLEFSALPGFRLASAWLGEELSVVSGALIEISLEPLFQGAGSKLPEILVLVLFHFDVHEVTH